MKAIMMGENEMEMVDDDNDDDDEIVDGDKDDGDKRPVTTGDEEGDANPAISAGDQEDDASDSNQNLDAPPIRVPDRNIYRRRRKNLLR